MRTLSLTAVLLCVALAVPAQAGPSAAAVGQVALRDYLAPLTRPDFKPVQVRVFACRPVGRWQGCRFRVVGVTVCRGVVRSRLVEDGEYLAWTPRVHCPQKPRV